MVRVQLKDCQLIAIETERYSQYKLLKRLSEVIAPTHFREPGQKYKIIFVVFWSK